jgi:hypothetical protein
MIGEVAVCLAQDLSKSDLPGGFWTPGAADAEKIIPRLIDKAGMQFALFTETGDRCSIESELFVSEAPNAGESRKMEGAAQ